MRLSLAVAAMIALPAAALSQMASPAQGQKEMQQSNAADRLGGYQPAQPALSGPVPPGSRVIYQQAPSPAEAYPAPPPMEHYPFCNAASSITACNAADSLANTIANRFGWRNIAAATFGTGAA